MILCGRTPARCPGLHPEHRPLGWFGTAPSPSIRSPNRKHDYVAWSPSKSLSLGAVLGIPSTRTTNNNERIHRHRLSYVDFSDVQPCSCKLCPVLRDHRGTQDGKQRPSEGPHLSAAHAPDSSSLTPDEICFFLAHYFHVSFPTETV